MRKNKVSIGIMIFALSASLVAPFILAPKSQAFGFGDIYLPLISLFTGKDSVENTVQTGTSINTTTQETVHTGQNAVSNVGTTTTAATTGASLVINGDPARANLTTHAVDPKTCDAISSGFFSSLVDDIGSALASSTLGDKTNAANTFNIGRKKAQVQASILCLEAYQKAILSIAAGTSTSLIQSQIVESNRIVINNKLIAANQALTQLKAQEDASLGDIFQAIGISLALDLNKNLTTRYVNELKNDLHIGNYDQYTKALADQVYAVNYIQNNYAGDPTQQLILTSLLKARNIPGPLTNNVYYQNATALSLNQANAARPSTANLADWSNASWYDTVANSVSPDAFASSRMKSSDAALNQVLASAQANAQLEVQNGQGFKGTRTCTDRTSDNQKIDQLTTKTTSDYQAATKALVSLRSEKISQIIEQQRSGLAVNPQLDAEIAKAQDAVALAKGNMDNLPEKVNGGVLKLCSAIESPGNFVADGIQNLIKQQLDQSTNLKTGNIPLYAQIASKYLNNFVTGMLLGKSGKQSLSDAFGQLTSGALSGLTQAALDSASQTGQSLAVNLLQANVDNTVAKNVVNLTWDVSSVNGAKGVNIYRGTTLIKKSGDLKGTMKDGPICDPATYRAAATDSAGNEIGGAETSVPVTQGRLFPCTNGVPPGGGTASKPKFDVGVPVATAGLPFTGAPAQWGGTSDYNGSYTYSVHWDVSNVPNATSVSLSFYRGAGNLLLKKDNLNLSDNVTLGTDLAAGTYSIHMTVWKESGISSMAAYDIPITINSSSTAFAPASSGRVAGAYTGIFEPRGPALINPY